MVLCPRGFHLKKQSVPKDQDCTGFKFALEDKIEFYFYANNRMKIKKIYERFLQRYKILEKTARKTAK